MKNKSKRSRSPWDYLLGTNEYQWIKLPYNIWPALNGVGLSGWDIPIFISILMKKRLESDRIYLPFDYIQATTGSNKNAIFASLAKFRQMGLKKIRNSTYDVEAFLSLIKNSILYQVKPVDADNKDHDCVEDLVEEIHVK